MFKTDLQWRTLTPLHPYPQLLIQHWVHIEADTSLWLECSLFLLWVWTLNAGNTYWCHYLNGSSFPCLGPLPGGPWDALTLKIWPQWAPIKHLTCPGLILGPNRLLSHFTSTVSVSSSTKWVYSHHTLSSGDKVLNTRSLNDSSLSLSLLPNFRPKDARPGGAPSRSTVETVVVVTAVF